MADLIDKGFALKTYQNVCFGISCYDCKARDEFGACLFEQWIRGLPSAESEQKEVIPHRNYQYLSDYWCECGNHLGKKYEVTYCSDCGRKVNWDG